ncbi:MAG TPA: ATP-binding protein, partial [Pararobbsia sp.]|nr:ATP-binding protein [Pararobbsia sp.]
LRVLQLVSNLLDNALARHRAEARVVVEARVERGMVVICVGDSGAPIPQAELARIFEPRARNGSAAEPEESDLALFLCAQIVNAHAGSLQVSSSAHDGTHFVVMLPIGK